jgi:hypothetical protein
VNFEAVGGKYPAAEICFQDPAGGEKIEIIGLNRCGLDGAWFLEPDE